MSRDCSSLLQAHYRLDGHPHVNPIHEVLVGEKRVYLIFPRSHSDLHSYVRARKRLREHEARRLFRQMAETVAACHEQGIVLRDLKLRKFVFADPQRWVLFLANCDWKLYFYCLKWRGCNRSAVVPIAAVPNFTKYLTQVEISPAIGSDRTNRSLASSTFLLLLSLTQRSIVRITI